jgi:hypothetical protein
MALWVKSCRGAVKTRRPLYPPEAAATVTERCVR